jgi:hypothetical protein
MVGNKIQIQSAASRCCEMNETSGKREIKGKYLARKK